MKRLKYINETVDLLVSKIKEIGIVKLDTEKFKNDTEDIKDTIGRIEIKVGHISLYIFNLNCFL